MSQLIAPTPNVRRTPKRWTKREYNAAAERGTFRGMHVYLYRGELIEMSSMGALHVQGVKRLNYWLIDTFRPEFEVRMGASFELQDESMPEPDGAVVTAEQDARRPHPNAAVMLIEVCDSSLELDQEMAFDYAASAVPEYWIINVRDRQIEVYRNPVADSASLTGGRYADRQVFDTGQSISPLARPEVSVAVNALADVG
jgi:Uma2 family endonuclease